jgi:hypothetical protein
MMTISEYAVSIGKTFVLPRQGIIPAALALQLLHAVGEVAGCQARYLSGEHDASQRDAALRQALANTLRLTVLYAVYAEAAPLFGTQQRLDDVPTQLALLFDHDPFYRDIVALHAIAHAYTVNPDGAAFSILLMRLSFLAARVGSNLNDLATTSLTPLGGGE